MRKKEKPKGSKSISKITALFVVILAVVSGIVWFSLSKKNSTVSPENLIASFQPRSFQDVLPEDKNFAAVEYLFREGILERDENKIFNPAQVLSRAEWVGLLVRLTRITPNVNKYQNCFSDVRNGPNSAAICFAKEQGWLEGFVDKKQTLNHWEFAPAALAQEEKKPFNPDNPVKKDEAVGSLSRLMNWKTNQAVDFAKEHKIIEGNSKDTLTKADAANIIYRSLATVPLGNDKFANDAQYQMERYRVETLVNLDDKLDRQRLEEWERNRKERQKKMAKIIGEKAAAEVIATTRDGSDAEYAAFIRKIRQKRMAEVIGEEAAAGIMVATRDGSDEESSAYTRKVREKNYEKILAEEKASGREPPLFNILQPLQKVLAEKGVIISQDDLLMLKKRPPHHEIEEKMSEPVINGRESARITLVLDKNYAVLSRSNWTKAKYMVPISLATFYQEGRSIIFAGLILVDLETGVSERAYRTRYYGPGDLVNLFKEGILGLEAEIGQTITQRLTATPSPAQSLNNYSDGYFEFLDIATGKSSIAFSTAQKPSIIVAADSGVDVRDWLPIRIEIKKDGSNFWSGKIEGSPSQVCQSSLRCSTNGPSGIGLDWKKIEITAYDKNGKIVATFSETYDSR